jgi:hypothetical protein
MRHVNSFTVVSQTKVPCASGCHVSRMDLFCFCSPAHVCNQLTHLHSHSDKPCLTSRGNLASAIIFSAFCNELLIVHISYVRFNCSLPATYYHGKHSETDRCLVTETTPAIDVDFVEMWCLLQVPPQVAFYVTSERSELLPSSLLA